MFAPMHLDRWLVLHHGARKHRRQPQPERWDEGRLCEVTVVDGCCRRNSAIRLDSVVRPTMARAHAVQSSTAGCGWCGGARKLPKVAARRSKAIESEVRAWRRRHSLGVGGAPSGDGLVTELRWPRRRRRRAANDAGVIGNASWRGRQDRPWNPTWLRALAAAATSAWEKRSVEHDVRVMSSSNPQA